MSIEWVSISKIKPPVNTWLEFYDGGKTMREPFHHIDKLDKRNEALINYLHNYTHWRKLTPPNKPEVSDAN